MKRISLFAMLLLALPAQAQTGKFIDIKPEHRVRNVNGNCGWCAIETVARHMGYEELKGAARGKGASRAESIGSYLRSQGVEFWQTTNRSQSWELMERFLAVDCPVLFSIPGHALVCCGVTEDKDGKWVWVIDNTGSEGTKIKAWPKSEFDRRHDGWVCGLFWRRQRPCPDCQPSTPRPGPHIDPTPDRLPKAPEKIPAPVPESKPDPKPEVKPDFDGQFAELRKLIKDIPAGPPGKNGADGKPGAPGPQGPAGKDADTRALQAQLDAMQSRISTLETTLSSLQGVISVKVEPVPQK